eukprot:1097468-Prorocentrum_lima.AAC.1
MADLHPRLRERVELTQAPHLVGQGEIPRVRPPRACVRMTLQHRHHLRSRHRVRHQTLEVLQLR